MQAQHQKTASYHSKPASLVAVMPRPVVHYCSPSPFITITRPKSWQSFYHPMQVEGWVDLATGVTPCQRLFISSYAKHSCMWWDSIIGFVQSTGPQYMSHMSQSSLFNTLCCCGWYFSVLYLIRLPLVRQRQVINWKKISCHLICCVFIQRHPVWPIAALCGLWGCNNTACSIYRLDTSDQTWLL